MSNLMNSDTTGRVPGPAVGMAVIVAVTALVVLPIVVEPARLLCAVVFCLVVPGFGWAYRAALGDMGDTLALAVMISMSATILVATAMVAMDWWSVTAGVAVLTAFGLLGFVPYRRFGKGRATG